MADPTPHQNDGHQPSQLYPAQPSCAPQHPTYVHAKGTGNAYGPQKENMYPPSQYEPAYGNARVSVQYQQPTPERSFQAPNLSTDQHPQPPTSSDRRLHTPNRLSTTQKSKAVATPAQQRSVDYSAILLSLAEEYLVAAYDCMSESKDRKSVSKSKDYYRLVATALGCLETVLAKFKLQPEAEATVRLRYATILHEETVNVMEAEEALSKGIAIADRHKLFDLKYNMQHLLVRVLFQTQTTAAFKFLERIVKDAEAYQHTAWVYAFRFLEIFLRLELGPESRQDTNSALSALNRLSILAHTHGDTGIVAIAETLRAWVYIRSSNSAESFEEAQTALAVARGLQGSGATKDVPQVIIMTAFVDLCCYLQHFDPTQAQEKMKHMYDQLAVVIPESSNWLVDGSFSVPLRQESNFRSHREDGIVKSRSDGLLSLMFNWLPKDDIYTVGYLLSGIALVHPPRQPSRKAENMFATGMKKVSYDQAQSDALARPIVSIASLQLWRQHLISYMRVHLAFVLCSRSEWATAKQHLNDFHDIARSWSKIPAPLGSLYSLLEATCLQGTGRLNDSLVLHQSLFRFDSNVGPSASHILDDISLIAALNCLLILRDPHHQNHDKANKLFTQISPSCSSHPNRQIQAAYHLVHTVLPEEATIIGRKQTLQQALTAAKASSNNTSLCIALGLMHWYFFRNQVTEQAEKSARAAQNMAHKVENKMWISATAGTMGKHLEAAGRPADAEAAFTEGWEAAESFAPEVRMELGWTGEVTDAVEMREPG